MLFFLLMYLPEISEGSPLYQFLTLVTLVTILDFMLSNNSIYYYSTMVLIYRLIHIETPIMILISSLSLLPKYPLTGKFNPPLSLRLQGTPSSWDPVTS